MPALTIVRRPSFCVLAAVLMLAALGGSPKAKAQESATVVEGPVQGPRTAPAIVARAEAAYPGLVNRLMVHAALACAHETSDTKPACEVRSLREHSPAAGFAVGVHDARGDAMGPGQAELLRAYESARTAHPELVSVSTPAPARCVGAPFGCEQETVARAGLVQGVGLFLRSVADRSTNDR